MSETKSESTSPLDADETNEFFAQALIGMARVAPTGRFMLVNQALCRMLGYSRGELLTLRFLDVTHSEDVADSRALVSGLIEGARPCNSFEKRFIHKNAGTIHALLSATLTRDEDGEPLYFLIQIIDVSEQRRRLETQDAHAAVLEMVATDASLSAVLDKIVKHAEGRNPEVRASILLLSKDKCTLRHGAAPSLPTEYNEIVDGLPIGVGVGSCGTSAATAERVIVEDVKNHPYWAPYQELVEIGAFGACWSHPIIDAHGEVLGTFAMYYSEPRTPEPSDLEFAQATARLAAIAIARRHSEEALSQSEARLRTVFENAPEALLLLDVQTDRFVDANANALQLFGISMTELCSSSLEQISPEVQPDGRSSAETLAKLIEAAAAGRPATFEWVYLHRSGREIPCKTRLLLLPSNEGVTVRASILDISDLKSVEQALRASEENLRITLDSMGDAVIATDAEGLITRLNPGAEDLNGMKSAEALGRPFAEVFRFAHKDTHEAVDSPIDRILCEDEAVSLPRDTVLLGQDDRRRRVADSGAPIRDRDGRVVGVVLVLRDVSEEFELQEQLRQAHRTEAIGQLASGIAHDFNNLLTAILGNAELLAMQLDEQSTEADLTKQIIQASTRAENLTRQLLAFSRKRQMQTTTVDLHAVIDEVVALLARTIDKRIEIKLDLKAEDPFVLGDSSQLQSAVLNLAVNARDAMPSGGQLEFRSRNLDLDEDFCSAPNRQIVPGQYLEFSLSDTGIGMDPEIQKSIFEPFFTTKEQGSGTGLGLAGVYGTVRSHGGLISVESKPHCGATFSVLLPRAPSGKRTNVASRTGEPILGHGNILVVDDEELVRNFAAKALQQLGYTVTTCADGAEAVELFATRPQEFILVILDMIMPKLDGPDTFRRLRSIRADVRVLMVSGFSPNHVADAMLVNGAVGLLTKPFHLEELSREVARACTMG